MDLMDEIKEDLRNEQARQFWAKYGKMIAAFAVMLVLVTAVTSGYKQYSEYKAGKDAEAFTQAIEMSEMKKRDEALQKLSSMVDNASGGYKTLALFSQADIKAKAGDKAGAFAVYEQLSNAKGVDSVYRELAVIYASYYQLDLPNPDFAAMKKRLQPLTEAGKPWRYSALELQGLIAIQSGDKEKAKNIFDRIVADTNSDAPQALKARAQRIASTLSY